MKIEGIPDGWEQERVGQIHPGEYWVDNYGLAARWGADHPSSSKNYVIIRKIEKPKQYRPFANAAEFKPFRDRWVRRTYNGDLSNAGCFKFHAYDDSGVYDVGKHFTYQEMFDDGRQFDDGSPFGVEVTE